MINKTARLEFVSLTSNQTLEEDTSCAISVTNGTHLFGETSFTIEKDKKELKFDDKSFINFQYSSRESGQKDHFLHINFRHKATDQEIGRIQVSSRMLIENWNQNKNVVVQKKDELIKGVYLQYKVYQVTIDKSDPAPLLNLPEEKTVDIFSILFAKPDAFKEFQHGEKKKYKLMPAHEDHHNSEKISKKMKTVIFLLIFGIMMLLINTYLDFSKPPKNNKRKIKKNKKHI